MGNVIIKPVRDRDEYVEWYTNTETPIGCGTRAELLTELDRAGMEPGACPTCGSYVSAHSLPRARLDRADEHGSSGLDGFYRWDDTELIYEQRGLLRREDLYRAAVLLAEDREPEVWDLLAPLEGETEVHRG